MKPKQCLHAALVIGLVAGAWASSAAAECAMALSTAHVDFGTLDRNAIEPNSPMVALGARQLSLSLSCEHDSDLTLFLRGAAHDAARFKLGDRAHYRLQVRDALVDGTAVTLGEVSPAGVASGSAEKSRAWRPEHGLVPLKGGVPLRGKHLQAHIDIVAEAPRAALRVRDLAEWRAQAQVDMPAAGIGRELSLQARVVPAACDVTLSNGGSVDYGSRTAQQFNPSAPTLLEPRELTLNIGCDWPALVALHTQDNRDGSEAQGGTYSFGLGRHGGRPIGAYTVDVGNVTVGGWGAAYATETQDGGTTWSGASNRAVQLVKNAWLGFAALPGSTAGPQELTTLSATLAINPTVVALDELDIADGVRLDGSATIEIKYF